MGNPAALVTGGATRLGRHFSEALADKGFDIA
ncbi:MAG: short-chain dehydrogenase, partial [Halomonas sp.]|nr:short-chain dehydrogenase [Halomonas sp.]